ncbi:hypothetical protein ACGFI9_01905 [Micromonospora sp. NPDC048930]|uniref:hypothetical protein n=1 Tax=Micromonospora sp. NPDC048930 TaxID=3364261 RepID=UPI00371177BE
MSRFSRPGPRRWGLAAAAALVAAGLVATVSVGHADTGVRLDARPESLAFGKEVYHFDTVAQMTATSHLVVYGTVTAVEPGRTASVDEDPAAVGGDTRLRNVTIEVWDVLHNPKNMLVPPTVTLEEEGWDEEGRGYISNNVTWSEVGDAGYFFLRRDLDVSDPHTFLLASSDGRALEANGVLEPSNPENELATSISGMTAGLFYETVTDASAAVAAGTLTASAPTANQPVIEESGE